MIAAITFSASTPLDPQQMSPNNTRLIQSQSTIINSLLTNPRRIQKNMALNLTEIWNACISTDTNALWIRYCSQKC